MVFISYMSRLRAAISLKLYFRTARTWAVLTRTGTVPTRTGTVPISTKAFTSRTRAVPTPTGTVTTRTGTVSTRIGTVSILVFHTCGQSFGSLNMTRPMPTVLHILSNVDSVDRNNFHFFEDIRVKILFRKVP